MFLDNRLHFYLRRGAYVLCPCVSVFSVAIHLQISKLLPIVLLLKDIEIYIKKYMIKGTLLIYAEIFKKRAFRQTDS